MIKWSSGGPSTLPRRPGRREANTADLTKTFSSLTAPGSFKTRRLGLISLVWPSLSSSSTKRWVRGMHAWDLPTFAFGVEKNCAFCLTALASYSHVSEKGLSPLGPASYVFKVISSALLEKRGANDLDFNMVNFLKAKHITYGNERKPKRQLRPSPNEKENKSCPLNTGSHSSNIWKCKPTLILLPALRYGKLFEYFMAKTEKESRSSKWVSEREKASVSQVPGGEERRKGNRLHALTHSHTHTHV